MNESRSVAVWRTIGGDVPPVRGLLLLLVAIDVALIGFYVSSMTTGSPGGFVFDIGADRSYGEFFQYSKQLWGMILLLIIAIQRRAGVYVAWLAVLAYFFLDDAFMLHENAGWAVRDMHPARAGWAVHVGELMFVGAVGLILAALVLIGHLRARPGDRRISWVLLGAFALMVFFGIIVDAIHHLGFPGPELRTLFTTVEDGGEMILLSVIVGFLFAVAFCRHQPSASAATESGAESRSDPIAR